MEYIATQTVHIPTAEFLRLELHLMDTRPGVMTDTFITELIKRWLALENERLALRTNGPSLRGVQWKSLFLPEGTDLRTTHGDSVEFAKVCGHNIVSDDGSKLTPSQFANRQAKGRNAWRFIWLRFPGNERWVRADDCRTRKQQKARSLREAGGENNPAPTSSFSAFPGDRWDTSE